MTGIAIALAGSVCAFAVVARYQTMAYVHQFAPGAVVDLRGIRLSKSSLIRVEYRVALASDFNRAEWCLLPFGDVDLKK